MNKEKLRGLVEFVEESIADTTKLTLVTFPIYAGVMSELNNIGFYESCKDNFLGYIIGIAVAHFGMKTITSCIDTYHRKKLINIKL